MKMMVPRLCVLVAATSISLFAQPIAANPVLANLNWHTADLTNAVLMDFFSRAYGDSNMQVGTGAEFTSSANALGGLTSGNADVFAECWNDALTPCDSTSGTVAHATGVIGSTDLYVPAYVKDKFAIQELFDLTVEANFPSSFQVLAGISSWSEKTLIENYFSNDSGTYEHGTSLRWLYNSADPGASKLVFYDSASDYNAGVLQRIREGIQPFVFLCWEPDTITTVHLGTEVFKISYEDIVSGDMSSDWRTVFPNSNIMFVRRDDVDAFYESKFPDFKLDNSDISYLIQDFAGRASLQLASTNVNYGIAMTASASWWNCQEVGQQAAGTNPGGTASAWTPLATGIISSANDVCEQTYAASKWPRAKDPLLPEKLVVWTKICPPFVMPPDGEDKSYCDNWQSLTANSDVLGHQNLKGYSIDHIIETAAQLGYQRADVVLRCGPSTPWIVERASQELAHLSHSCITITDDRMSLVDFSAPWFSTGYQLLVKDLSNESGTKGADWTVFLQPFTQDAWFVLMATAGVIGILMFLLHKAEKAAKKRESVHSEQSFGDSAGDGGESAKLAILKIVTQFLENVGKFTGAIVMALYTGNMAAFLTVRQAAKMIESLEDLEGDANGSIAIMCASGAPNSTEIFLRDNYPLLYSRRVCVSSYIEMGEAVENGRAMAAYYEAPILEWLAKNSNCALKTVGQLFGLQEYGYTFPKGSTIRGPFSEAITETRSSSYDELSAKYLKSSSSCTASAFDTAKVDETPFMGLLVLWSIIAGAFLTWHFITKYKAKMQGS